MFYALRRFWRDRTGNFATMTAIVIIPLIACVGLGLDIASAVDLKTRLQNAADAAAVGAIAKNSPGVTAGLQMSGDGPIPAGQQDATTLFKSNLSANDLTSLVSFTPQVNKSGFIISSNVVFTASMPTTFMRVLGISSVSLSGTSTASIHTDSFIDFYMLLDNTPSMGIGATPADVAKMVANTPDQCGFACHETQNTNNYYTLAKKLGVTMRIDVVREATQALMDTATKTAQFQNQYRMGIYTFGTSAETAGLDEISALTSNLDDAKSKAAAIDLMTIPYQNYNNDQQTSFDTALTNLGAKITDPGNGTSNSNRAKYVFFVADGVGDSYKPGTCTEKTTGGRCQEPIDISYCNALKQRGIGIAVLYTTYLDLPTNSWWNTWIKPFKSDIGARMAACATPGLYFEVSPTEGISDAMTKLFQKILLNPRLTS